MNVYLKKGQKKPHVTTTFCFYQRNVGFVLIDIVVDH